MASENDISMGNIVYVDSELKNGVIVPEDGRDFFFEFKNVIIGTPRVGEAVQFRVLKDIDYGDVATDIVVLGDAARRASEKRAY